MSRYDPLQWHLTKTPPERSEVRLTFGDVERLVGSLPDSARSYRPWWGNSTRSSQAQAWQAAGFVVDEVNLTADLAVMSSMAFGCVSFGVSRFGCGYGVSGSVSTESRVLVSSFGGA